jgi:hypothetical protein
MAVRPSLILFILVASGAFAVALPALGQGGRESAGRCSVSEVSRHRMVVEGNLNFYVEPVTMAESGGEVLLAGTPNILWSRHSGAQTKLVAVDSLFGAVIASDGSARTVPSPIPAKLLGSIRALGRGDGTWDVVFAELPARESARPDTAVRLWYGVYDGSRWTAVEQLPLPPGAHLHPLHASPLVRQGDTLVWALVATTAGHHRDVVLFQRRGIGWHAELVPTRGAGYPGWSRSRTHLACCWR